MYEPVVGVLVVRIQGEMDMNFHNAAVALLERCVERTGQVQFFFDRLELESESPQYAKTAFFWLRENSARIQRITVLQPNWLKNVSGGPLAMLLGLPRLEATASREKFEARLAEAVALARYSLAG